MATPKLAHRRGATDAAPAREAVRSRPAWYAHGFNRVSVYRLAALTAALPRRARLALATAVATMAARRFPAEHAAACRSVARIVPHGDERARRAIVAETFRNFAVCFADLVTTNRRTDMARRLLARVEGEARLEAAVRGGRGVVALTAHVGNWELAGRLLEGRLGRRTQVVVAAEADPGVERFLRRRSETVTFVVTTDPTVTLPLFASLRRGEIVAMQGDRALGNRGDVAVRFFGAEAWFPLGPFVLARAAGALVVPSFCLLERDRRYAVTVGEPIAVAPGGERQALAHWVAELERVVAAHPEQWFNFFDVWRTAPAR